MQSNWQIERLVKARLLTVLEMFSVTAKRKDEARKKEDRVVYQNCIREIGELRSKIQELELILDIIRG